MKRTNKASSIYYYILVGVAVMILGGLLWWAIIGGADWVMKELDLGPRNWDYVAEYPSGIRVTGRGHEDGVIYSRVSAPMDVPEARFVELSVIVDGTELKMGEQADVEALNVKYGLMDSRHRPGWRILQITGRLRHLTVGFDDNDVVRQISVSGYTQPVVRHPTTEHIDLFFEGRRVDLPLSDEQMRDHFGRNPRIKRHFSLGP